VHRATASFDHLHALPKFAVRDDTRACGTRGTANGPGSHTPHIAAADRADPAPAIPILRCARTNLAFHGRSPTPSPDRRRVGARSPVETASLPPVGGQFPRPRISRASQVLPDKSGHV
jgi:hypothetical protein